MPKRRFRPVRRRRHPGLWVWAGFAASAALGALTATLVAGSDDQPTMTTQLAAGQLPDEVRRMITSYLDEEGYRPEVPPEEADSPDLPVEPPVPVEPPAPLVPVVPAAVPRTEPAEKTARPGAGPWPVTVVPDLAPGGGLLPVTIAAGPAEPEAPAPAAPPVEPMSAPVELRALDAPEPVEPHHAPEVVEPAEPAPSPELHVRSAPEPVVPEGRPEPDDGSYEIGEHGIGDADAVILPAGER